MPLFLQSGKEGSILFMQVLYIFLGIVQLSSWILQLEEIKSGTGVPNDFSSTALSSYQILLESLSFNI